MSLLRDIQNDLANAGADVATVLRKCKILASRLGSVEFAQWVDWELDGFPESQLTPDYRRLSIIYYASFVSVAWRVPKHPVLLEIIPEKHRESYTYIEFRDGIVKASAFSRGKTGANIQRPELALVIQGKMYPEMNCHAVWGEIPATEFEQLISSVKNRILDFVLKIEAENPAAGEALPNTHPVSAEKLQPLVNNTFYGPVGNLAQSSEHFNQNANIEVQSQDIARVVTELTAHLAELNLNARQKQRAEIQIATLNAEIAGGEPDPVIVRQAGRTLRNITEGAIASLLATAATNTQVWQWIHQILARF